MIGFDSKKFLDSLRSQLSGGSINPGILEREIGRGCSIHNVKTSQQYVAARNKVFEAEMNKQKQSPIPGNIYGFQIDANDDYHDNCFDAGMMNEFVKGSDPEFLMTRWSLHPDSEVIQLLNSIMYQENQEDGQKKYERMTQLTDVLIGYVKTGYDFYPLMMLIRENILNSQKSNKNIKSINTRKNTVTYVDSIEDSQRALSILEYHVDMYSPFSELYGLANRYRFIERYNDLYSTEAPVESKLAQVEVENDILATLENYDAAYVENLLTNQINYYKSKDKVFGHSSDTICSELRLLRKLVGKTIKREDTDEMESV